jgi:OmpA-OmpF porin, OOP family
MKKITIALMMAVLFFAPAFAQQDIEGAKDNPMFPTRMPNYFISEVANNFDVVEFNLAAGGTKNVTKEGTKSVVRYDFNNEPGKSKPSCLQILRNYEAAAKKIGAETIFLSTGEGIATFKLTKAGAEVWVKVETAGNDNSDLYVLTILEIEAMKQEITAVGMYDALSTDGHIALYINFETGKATIQPESQPIIDQIVEMLKANPSLKVSIEGHTDNAGNGPANQTLSENRAKAVMNAIISKGINKTLLTSKGWGQTKPVGDNKTDEGKAKNRRVEIVKI